MGIFDHAKGIGSYLYGGLEKLGSKLNEKQHGTQTNLPYFKTDRRRLQHLMTYGEEPPPPEQEWGRALRAGVQAAMGGKGQGATTSQKPMPVDEAAAVRRTYGPYAEAAVMADDPRRGDIDANLARQLAMAEGRGPSLAAQQYRSAQQENVAAQASLAAGGRGAQGQRFAAQNIGRSQAGLASGVAEARTREQMAAQGAYNQSLQSAQQADNERNALNAQLQQQTNQGNQEAYLQLLAAQLGLSEAELKARMQNVQQPSHGDRLINAWSFGLGGMAQGGGG